MEPKRIYKKKGEADPEEVKPTSDSPTKTGTEERPTRGGRGGRGGARGMDRHQNNQEGRQQYQKKGATQEGRGDRGDNKGENTERRFKKEQDQNSYYYKYHYKTFPKLERVQVTKDTEVPPLIPKDQRKKNPDPKEFDKTMNDLDHQINILKDKVVCILPVL